MPYAVDTPPAIVQPDLSGYAKKTDVPMPGSTMPPAVDGTGSAGTSKLYSPADHTHPSSVLKARLLTDANGEITWTYPAVNGVAFAVAPVVQVTVEAASGQPYLALITANTATSLKLKVLRAQALPQNLVSGLLGGVFNVFGAPVGAGVPVHVYAGKPTQ